MSVHLGLARPEEPAVSANDRRSLARTATAVGRVPCESTARSKVRAEADWTDISQLQVYVTDVFLNILLVCL
jgi:hypothetical protein